MACCGSVPDEGGSALARVDECLQELGSSSGRQLVGIAEGRDAADLVGFFDVGVEGLPDP